MIAADWYLIVFRILHIAFGVAWVGSAFFVTVFLEPSATALGPAAGPVMSDLMEKRKAGIVITLIGAVTVIAGGVLYWHDWHLKASWSDWIATDLGRVLTFGGVCAIVAFFVGSLGIPPTIDKMNALGAQVAAGGGPPSPEQGAQMHALQERLRLISRTDLVLLTLAILAMSTARYW